MNIPQADGKKKLFPRLIDVRPMEHDKLVKYISETTGLGKGAIMGVLGILAERMASWMSEGYSVKIDGLGRFTPSLKLREGTEREEADSESDESGAKRNHRNARSIEVGSVNFKADKQFVLAINKQISLVRSPYQSTIRPNSSPYTREQRLELLKGFLAENPFIKCQQYMQLTGMSKSSATKELRAFSDDPSTGILASGRAPHRVYVKAVTR